MSQSTRAHAGPAPAAGRDEGRRLDGFTTLLWLQGAFYLVTGVWPLVSIETFQMVTGPKTDHLVTGRESDHWLVMTAGVLITAVGLTLVVAAWRRTRAVELAVLAVGCAAGLTGIDVVYVSRGAIAPIYLADAAVEVVLIAAWAVVLVRGSWRVEP
jgi:hypothetical protein